MASKLRPLYDWLYIKIETLLLAHNARKEDRGYARSVTPLPALDKDYRSVVRPYWAQFRVAVPKKIHFRLFGNAEKKLGEHIDPRYIPDDLWFDRILPHYNNLIFAKALQDKCLFDLLFPDIRRPNTVIKNIAGIFYDGEWNILTRTEAAARVPGHGRIIVKPSVSTGQGHNVCFFDSSDMTPADAESVFDRYRQNFIIQEKLVQHEALARLNPASLNTLRIITFLFRDEVHILSACLRVGTPESELDNTSQGGSTYVVGRDGRLCRRGFSHRGGRWQYFDELPTGEPIDGYVIPGYDKAAAAVCSYARRMSHFKLIGWDIAIAPEAEPVFIEFNVLPGANQENDGPTFGDLTDEILTDVFGRR